MIFKKIFEFLHKEKKEEESEVSIKLIQNRLDAVLDSIVGNHWWKDRSGRYLGCNKTTAKLIGLTSPDEIIGKTDFDMPWAEQADDLIKNDKLVMSSKMTIDFQETADTGKGMMYLLTTKTPLYDEKNNIIGVVGTSVDITELKKTQKELETAKQKAEVASESKSEFIANMSHDLRTPITGMLGLAQDMINTADDTEASLLKPHDTIERTLSIIHTLLNNLIAKVQQDGKLLIGATNELLELFNEVLEVRCLETGKSKEALESFDFHQLVQHNIELLRAAAQHKHLDLSYDIAADVPIFLKGLGAYLDRSLLNLISNALKFTEKGFVKVTAQLVNSNAKTHHIGDAVTVQITVQDSGVGIPENKFDTIFEHFSRLTPSYQGLYKGAGLGLYTVKRYVTAMKGDITVDSELGTGTCFTLTLPFTVSDHADRQKKPFRLLKPKPIGDISTAREEQVTTPASKEKATATILLVEDSAMAALAVKASLKSLGCAFDVAETGTQAVSLAERHAYDLILMDIGLPDFSGVEATKKIRALSDPKKARVPIVAVTGHAGNPDRRQEALDAGMQEVISKPAQKLALELILDSYVFKKSDIQTAQPLIAPSDATPTPEPELAVLDWDACVRMCQDDTDMARELLSVLAADLKKTAPLLATDYANNDTRALRDTLHRVRGGVCYLKLPQLDHALSTFHEAIKAAPQDPSHVKQAYGAVQQAIEAYLKTWAAWSQKHNS